MDVLVTGAGGRIGSHVTERLLTDGHRVRALTLAGDPRTAALKQAGASVMTGDLRNGDSLLEATADVDAVCHTAAALTLHAIDDATFVEVNLRGTFNLLDAVRRSAPNIERFVYVSSDAVYWDGSGAAAYLPVDEAHPLLGGSIYGATKVGAEQLCRAFQATYSVPCAIMRPTATAEPAELIDPEGAFGKRWFLQTALQWYGSRPTLKPAEQSLLAALREVDDGTEKIFLLIPPNGAVPLTMMTAASDTAAAMLAMIQPTEAIGEAFNVGPTAPHSQRLFLEYLAERLGIELVEIRHSSARPSWYISSAKAQSVLGYRPKLDAFEMIDAALDARVAG